MGGNSRRQSAGCAASQPGRYLRCVLQGRHRCGGGRALLLLLGVEIAPSRVAAGGSVLGTRGTPGDDLGVHGHASRGG